jgi:nucleoid-associated protein YgaU
MMMDPAVKTALALCVLLIGFCAATLLWGDKPTGAPPGPAAEEPLLIGARLDAAAAAERIRRGDRFPPLGRGSAAAASGSRPAVVVTPSDRPEAPPPLASDFPQTDRQANARWGQSLESMLPTAMPADQPTTHRIIDGDTLPALAQRYLGSAARAGEIFEANRGVLLDPELLPIGVELKIPSRPLSPVPHP